MVERLWLLDCGATGAASSHGLQGFSALISHYAAAAQTTTTNVLCWFGILRASKAPSRTSDHRPWKRTEPHNIRICITTLTHWMSADKRGLATVVESADQDGKDF